MDYKSLQPYQEYVNKYADMFDLDPDMLNAIMYQESTGNPRAVSPAGAAGLMQLMPATAEALGVTDRFNPEQSIFGGAKLLREELDRFGDPELALIAYNAGSRNLKNWMKKSGALDASGVLAYVDEKDIKEAAEYTPKVLGHYNALKQGKPTPNTRANIEQTQQEQVLAQANGEDPDTSAFGSLEEFQDKAAAVINDPSFDTMSTANRLRKINQIYNEKIWGADVKQNIREITDEILSVDPDYVPSVLGQVIGPLEAGATVEDISAELNTIKSNLYEQMEESGVSSSLYGNKVEEYFQAQQQELEARIEARDLGYAGALVQSTKEFVRGAAQTFTTPIGALPKLAGFTETGEAIQNIPTALLGATNRKFEYLTYENGEIAYDKYGQPMTTLNAAIVQGAGQLGGLLAGGALLKGAQLGATAIASAFFGANSLTNMDTAYEYATNGGADHTSAVAASLLTLPVSALETYADTVTLGFSRPWIKGLKVPTTKALAVGQAVADASPQALRPYVTAAGRGAAGAVKAAPAEAFAEGATEATAQLAGYLASGNRDVFNRTAIEESAFVGGIVGGVFGAGVAASTVRPPATEQQPTASVPELLGLPAPDDVRIDSDVVIPLPETPSPEEAQVLTQAFEEFQQSVDFERTFTVRSLADIPVEALQLMGMEAVRIGQQSVTLRKITEHIPADVADEINTLDSRIDDLLAAEEDAPSPYDAPKIQADIIGLGRELVATTVDELIPGIVKVAAERADIVKRITQLNRAVKKPTNPAQRAQVKQQLEFARASLEAFDLALPDKLPRSIKAKGLSVPVGSAEYLTKRAELTKKQAQLKRMLSPTYVNNIKAREAELTSLLNRRAALANQAEYVIADQPAILEKGIKYDGEGSVAYVLPTVDGWFVADMDGRPISRTLRFLSDAIQTADTVTKKAPRDLTQKDIFIAQDAQTAPTQRFRQPIDETTAARPDTTQRSATVNTEPQQPAAVDVVGSSPKLERTANGRYKLPDNEQAFRESDQIVEERKGLRGRKSKQVKSFTRPIPANGPLPKEFEQEAAFQPAPFGTSGTPIAERDVMRTIGEALAVINDKYSFLVGSPLPQNVLGMVEYGKFADRVKYVNDLPSAVHELAHVIDHTLEFITDRVPDDVKDALRSTADNFYPVTGLPDVVRLREGLAMFLENYVTRNPVHRDLRNWFEGAYRNEFPEFFDATQAIKDAYTAFRQQSDQDYILANSRARKESQRPIPKAFRAIKNSFFSAFQRNWTNSRNEMEEFDKVVADLRPDLAKTDPVKKFSLNKLANTLGMQSRQIANQAIYKQFVDFNGNVLNWGPSLADILKPVEQYYDDLSAYMTAKRASAYFNERGIDSGFDPDRAASLVKAYQLSNDTKDKLVVQTAEKLWTWTSGVLEVAAMRTPYMRVVVEQLKAANLAETGTTHGYYVPFIREGYNGVPVFGKLIEGSERQIEDPLLHLANYAHNVFYIANKRFVMEQLFDWAQPGIAAPISQWVYKVRPDNARAYEQNLDALIAKAEKEFGESFSEAEKAFYRKTAMLFDPKSVFGSSPEGYEIFPFPDKDGKEQFYEVKSEMLAAFDSSLPSFTKSPWFYLTAVLWRNVLRAGAVGLNIYFPLKNLLRYDVLTFWRNAPSDGSARDAIKAGTIDLAGVMQSLIATSLPKIGVRTANKVFNTGWAEQSERIGAKSGTFLGSSIIDQQIKTATGLKAIDATVKSVEWFESMLNSFEEAPRLQAMKMRAKQLGITDSKAPLSTENAIDLMMTYAYATTNFQVGGRQARVANLIFPFFTARVAAISQLKHDIPRAPWRHASIGMTFLTLGLIKAMLDAEDERMQNLEPEVLSRGPIFPVVRDTGEEIAVRFQLGSYESIPYNVAYSLMSLVMRDDRLAPTAIEWMSSFAKNYAPIDPFSLNSLPTAMKVPMELLTNKSFYSGRQIVPGSLTYEAPEFQYTEYTSEIAKKLGATLGISPLKLEHAVRAIAPVTLDYVRVAERLAGTDASKQRAPKNILEDLFVYYEPPEAFDDRSTTMFNEAVSRFNALKDVGSPEEEKTRKRLLEIQGNLSDIRILLGANIEDKELRADLYRKKREFLNEGIELAYEGGPDRVRQIPGIEAKAKRLKEQRKQDRIAYRKSVLGKE